MVVGAKVYELTDGFLWFVCGLYVGILASFLMQHADSCLLFPQGRNDFIQLMANAQQGQQIHEQQDEAEIQKLTTSASKGSNLTP